MRDEQDRPREGLERSFERLAALEVEMVRRLVDNEEVRARRNDERQCESPPLAAGQRDDGLLVLRPAREEKAAEQLLRVRPLQPRRPLHALQHRAARVQLQLLL